MQQAVQHLPGTDHSGGAHHPHQMLNIRRLASHSRHLLFKVGGQGAMLLFARH